MYQPTVNVGRALRVAPVAVHFFLVFLREIVSSGIDMTYRVLHPSRPIEPDVIEFPLRVQTGVGITSIANTISLTPGTLTMDHDPDTNSLYIHAVAGRRRETTVAPLRRWEDLLLLILDEEFDPEDEPPSRPYQRAPAALQSGPTSDSGGNNDDS
jgi:multicomponent Na+:H+ antiporter subunit E